MKISKSLIQPEKLTDSLRSKVCYGCIIVQTLHTVCNIPHMWVHVLLPSPSALDRVPLEYGRSSVNKSSSHIRRTVQNYENS